MRLHSLTIHGPTVFKDPVTIPFRDLPQGLIAVCGPNGSGKTTILDAIYAAWYRRFPTREGSLQDHFQPTREGRIELTYLLRGEVWRHTLLIDALRRKGEGHILTEDGTPIVSGKLPDFDAWVRNNLPPEELVLASVFCPQNRRGNFLNMRKADRKALFVRLLGIEHLEVLAGKAREVGGLLAAKVANLASDVAALEEEQTAADARHRDLFAASGDYTETKVLVKAQEGVVVEAETRVRQFDDADRYLADAKQVDERLLAVARQRDSELVLSDKSMERELTNLHNEEERCQARKEEYSALLLERPVVEKAERAHAAGIADLKVVDAQIVTAEAAVADARHKTIAYLSAREKLNTSKRLHDRSALTAQLLNDVPCDTEATPYSGCPLLVDAQAAAAKLPVLFTDAETNLDLVKGLGYSPNAEPDAQRAVVDLQDTARRLRKDCEAVAGIIARKGAILAAADGDAANREALKHIAARRRDAVAHAAHEERTIRSVATTEQAKIHSEWAPKKEAGMALYKALSCANAEEATARRHGATGRLELARHELSDRNAKLAMLQAQVKAHTSVLAIHDARIRKLTGSARLHGLLAKQRAAFHDVARAFGKDGIQALEIDNAGPEVSALTNRLLVECYGNRFTVQLVTQALKKSATKKEAISGEGFKEDFDLVVYDNEAGRQSSADDLSGGERVIVSEALSLALAIFNAKRSGFPLETLIRDETCGALDPDNADRYIRMLRKAQALGDFHQVLFVSHQPEVSKQADHVIDVPALRRNASATA